MKLFYKTLPTLLAVAAPVQLLAGQNGYNYMGSGMGYGGWFFGPLMMILFFGLIIAAVIFALRLAGFGGQAQGNRAIDILDERFASGEIDEAEYAKRRKALKG